MFNSSPEPELNESWTKWDDVHKVPGTELVVTNASFFLLLPSLRLVSVSQSRLDHMK